MGGLGFATGVVSAFNANNNMNRHDQLYSGYAQAHRYNAIVLREMANLTGAAYGGKEDQQRRISGLALGASRAASIESGTGTGGSNADMQRQNELFAELDALNVRYEGELEKHNLRRMAEGEDRASTLNLNQMYSGSDKFLGILGAFLGGSSGGYR